MNSVQNYSFIPFQTTKISPFKIIFFLGFFLSGCINRGFIETNQNTNFDNDPLRITLPVDEDSTSMLPGRVNDGNEESNSVERNEVESYSAGIREDFIDFPGMLSNIPPTAEEVLAPGNFDPSMELSSKYLICPTIPNTVPTIPPGPYDEDGGDCALRSKSAEIEDWLTALEQIAASCQANRESNWTTALSARAYLDTKIDELEEMEPETPQDEEGEMENTGGTSQNTGVSLVLSLLQQVQGTGGSSSTGDSTSTMEGLLGGHSQRYTQILKSIGEDVEIYCIMIDELVKPLWLACNEINNYQDSHSPDPDLYHSMIEAMTNAAQVNYDQTEIFFTDTLQTNGWDGFRSTFSGASIDCDPILLLSSPPKFTFNMNTFCREGPSSEYEKVATFLEGQDVQLEGRNHHEPRWWLVPDPGKRGNCWVADSTGSAEGPIEELGIFAAPPLVIKPNDNQPKTKTCSADLSAPACAAAGGTMIGGEVTGASSCFCP